jgi:hypothetical protein
MGNEPIPLPSESDIQEKSVLGLVGRVMEVLKSHPSRLEAESACVIAHELVSMSARRGPMFHSSLDGLGSESE